MAKVQFFNIPALNLKLSPFAAGDGQVLVAKNVERDMIGGWKKRTGYTTFLGTPDTSQINDLFSWTRNDGTSNYLYRTSGSSLYYSVQGTGAWTKPAGGTIADGAHFGFAVLDDVMVGGDGNGESKSNTTGTSFSDITTSEGAPVAEVWEEYQGRIWATKGTATSGTATDWIYSTVGTATDWTTDSSSIRQPGAGRTNSLFKAADRLNGGKDSGLMHRYDGYSLLDLSTNLAPSSPYSIGETEGYKFYLNRLGVYGYGGGRPEKISIPIERQIYNSVGSGIAGTTFDSAPGVVYRNDYYCSVGTITDDLIQETISDCIIKYDVELDEWTNYSFADRPRAWGTFEDVDGNEKLIFGDSGGQCYQMDGNTYSDNGSPIEAKLIGFIHGGTFEEKKWNWINGMFNPGCKAKIQIAISDTFTPRTLNWVDIGDANDGVVDYRFPAGTRGRFLFYKIYENSTATPFAFYGWEFDAQVERH
jgi:hypothetical protein